MPYKDPIIAKQKATERKKCWQDREREKRISAGLLEDGRGKHEKHVKGSNHYRWNNGRMVDNDGYALIRVGVSHPLADPNGYAHEHILVIFSAQRPGAYLLQNYPDVYIPHHKNGDKLDNRIENLPVITRKEHNKIHNQEKARDELGRFSGRTHDDLPWRKRL